MKMTKAENGVDIEFMNENSNLEFRGPPQTEKIRFKECFKRENSSRF